MGHAIGKDVYRKLGKKIDGLTMRAPWNERLHAVLMELYTAEEAELIASMPYSPVDVDGIVQTVGWDRAQIEKVLESLCFKGLMLDVWTGEKYLYIISPLVIGIFEFTMMRTEGKLNTKEWARLFHAYMEDDHEFLAANFGKDKRVSPLRTLPHEGAVDESEFVEVLDYEKATAIVEKAGTCAIGLCSCRHERFHLDEKTCEVPLEACSSFGTAADTMIQHGFAKKVSKTEMLENLARSKEMGLVFCADNVKNDVSFICHCCGCCCNVLRAVSRYGFPNMLVTSNFIARTNEETCSACGTCADQCPIDAITMNEEGDPQVDEGACLGCGVCALACPTESMRLTARPQRVFHPENTFERVILQCLERGTLQNQMFSDPGKLTHRFMRGVVGGFLRLPPVKQTIMSDALRSRFLATIARRA